ncbi:MAG: PorV/PorQ family protein [Candidatus Zixiibacteriota bacterium]|nr:MAG: PorV/PorQ family protein [candidate division Zixibacteria bacterium]
MSVFSSCRLLIISSFTILASILLFPSTGECQVISGHSRFLLVAPDARGKSLADGGSVFSKSAASVYYNPALLVTGYQFSAEVNYCKHLPLLSDVSISNYFISKSLNDWGYFGIGYSRHDYGGGERLDEYYRTIKPYAYSLGIWYAISFDPYNSCGIGVKFIKIHAGRYRIDSSTLEASSMAIDFGMLSRNHLPQATWQNDEIFYPHINRLFKVERDKGFSFGISFSNLGRDLEYEHYPYSESIPKRLRVAAGYQAVDSEPVGLRLTVDATRVLIDMDDSFREEWSEVAWSYGLESTFYYIVHFRFGRLLDRGDHQRYNTIGFGVGPEWLSLDYSYVLDSDDRWNRSGEEYSFSLRCNISP